MCEELSYQIINTSDVNQVGKNHYKKESISVGSSEQRRDAIS